MRFGAVYGLIFALATSAVASDFSLQLPIDCTLGQTCFIQNQVDRDPGPGVLDYQCGGLSYNGHKGTDFRLSTLADMHQGVDVLAAASGVVRGIRDGIADVGPNQDTQGKECGNGLVLLHPDGWETQYCHMKNGSLQVQAGQKITAGTVLGQVGLSGKSEFPHLHLSIRHNGEVIDPFDLSAFATCGKAGETIWQNAPGYVAGGLLDGGFSPAVPDYAAIKSGTADQSPLPVNAPALVFWAFAYGGQNGDVLELTVDGPEGRLVDHRVTLAKDQAQFYRAAGKRLKTQTWPLGDYIGTATLIRNGTKIDQMTQPMNMR